MTAYRRTEHNFSLQRAVVAAKKFKLPLVVLEALRSGYPWASSRLHSFVLDGMADNARRFEESPVSYYAYVEGEPGQGRGLLSTLASQAAVVVTDDYPAFFLPRMLEAAAKQLRVRLEAVDSNGLLPLRAADRVFGTAYAFRRFLQKNLREHLSEFPAPDPLRGLSIPKLDELPVEATGVWPNAATELMSGSAIDLEALPVDHSVEIVETRGGAREASRRLDDFLQHRLARYAEDRNHPDLEATSVLSPYLHFGHLSSHAVFAEIMAQEDWDVDQLGPDASGKRSGWWGVSESAEAFLDQLVTWRELGFNMCARSRDYDRYESLPEWAQATLAEHVKDPRPHVYTLEELERSDTHDPVWNAAQTQLRRDGILHNYLRMLWGKKILEWSPTPQDALAVMVELNNKYALDGRDPNSYSGIFWCLGRYDRAWGPERPIFGKIRYMSSENTVRKLKLSDYLARYSA
jgi:deoxyribodipyrimidine photo-lyase